MKKLFTYCLIIAAGFATGLYAQDDYEITPLPFSVRMYNEYAPVFYNGGLIFCSDRDEVGLTQFSTVKNRGIVNLYNSNPSGDDKWTDPKIFAKKLKTNWHEGPLTISGDGKTMYYSRNINASKKLKGSKKVKDRMGIFSAKYEGDEWVMDKPFIHNGERYSTMHPSLSADGRFLYFVSDMRGGQGQYDIYVCQLENGVWSKPENLGPNVNTDKDDVFPFIHPSGRLYFSSKGHASIGRLDIFYTEKVEGNWQKIRHLPEPLNSKRDDFGFIINENFDEGYLSSNRKRSNDDIYRFFVTMPEFNECPEMVIEDYCYTFFEQGSMDIDSTSLKYEWDLGDGTKIRSLEANHCFKEKGTYMIQLNVIDTLTGDVLLNEASMLFEVDDTKQMFISSPDTAYVGEEIQFGSEQSYIDEQIEKYYWDFGDGHMVSGPSTMYSFNRKGEYIVKLGAKTVIGEMEESKKYCNSKKIVVLRKRK